MRQRSRSNQTRLISQTCSRRADRSFRGLVVVLLTILTATTNADVPTVGDQGDLPDGLPSFLIPDVPFTVETLKIIAPFALALALVGLLESLLTAKLVDDITDTYSCKARESWG